MGDQTSSHKAVLFSPLSFLVHIAMRFLHVILAVLLVLPIHGSSSTHVGKTPPLALVKPPEKMQQRKRTRIQTAQNFRSKTLAPQRQAIESDKSWLTTSNRTCHQWNVQKWSLCDALQGFLTWRFAQSQSLIVGFLAFLFNLHIPILGPQNPTSYLYGWIACGFIEGFFGDGDVEGDNGISIDILVMVIVWGCLKSFLLSKARALAARTIAIAKKKAEIADKRLINAPALMRVPAKMIVGSFPLNVLYKMAAETESL